MSEENIENITKSDTNFAPATADHHVLPDMNFYGRCFINNIYIPKKVLYIYTYIYIYIYFVHTKYIYSDFGIGFDCRSGFLCTVGTCEKMSLFLELI